MLTLQFLAADILGQTCSSKDGNVGLDLEPVADVLYSCLIPNEQERNQLTFTAADVASAPHNSAATCSKAWHTSTVLQQRMAVKREVLRLCQHLHVPVTLKAAQTINSMQELKVGC